MKKSYFFISIIFLSTILFAQGNGGSISVQGVLRQANGSAAADGQYAVTFSIWNQESGGYMVWGSGNEGHFPNLVVKNGVYNVELVVGDSYLNAGGDHWLEVQVGSETLSPRLKLNVTPYEQLFLANAHNIVLESGPVGLGTQSPNVDSYLDVAGGRIRDVTGFVAPVGSVTMFAGTAAPDGWLICGGGVVPSGSQYDELRDLLGQSYGDAWGTLPDMRGKMPAGYNSGNGYFNSFRDNYGRYQPTHRSHGHSVSADQDPHYHYIGNHGHGITDDGHIHSGDDFHHVSWGFDGNAAWSTGGGWGSNDVHSNTTGITVNSGGAGWAWENSNLNSGTDPAISVDQENSSDGDAAIGNMPPYAVFTFIIKY